ncbi:MAG: AAA family ATPase [Methanolobus sp.]|nr:AAA family ATPase [Methanolobus sp.]
MIIRKLTIENYRNYTSFEVELKKFTLIIGENNIGKTNLLNALGLIFSQEITFYKKRQLEIDDINYKATDKLRTEIAQGTIPANDIQFPSVKVEVILEDFNSNADQEAIVGDWFIDKDLKQAKLTYIFNKRKDLTKWVDEQREKISKIQKKEGENDIDFFNRKKSLIDFPIKAYEYNIYGGLDSTKRVDNYFLRMLRFEFLGALRDAKTELIASNDYRLLYKILSNRPENKFEDLKEQLTVLNEKIKENTELKEIQKQISTYLKKISLDSDDNNKVEFLFSKVEETELLKKLSLIYGNDPVNVERNGLGRNNLLYISLIISHLTNSADNNTKIFFRLVGIEEPESHLHPHLQQHLADNIQSETSENLQLIITSHSTHITSKLDLENTVVLFYDKKSQCHKSHYILNGFADENGKINKAGKETQRYLRRYLDATKSTMFFARKIILVEGISEQLLLPKLFKLHTNKTLEEVGCNLVNVNGVAFKHFLELIKNGYFIKCLALTDSDSNTQTENRAEDLKTAYQTPNESIIRIEISAESTFEKDLIAANKNGDGKDILLKAIEITRPVKGKELKEATISEIVLDDFFKLIESRKADGKKESDFKAAFATDLLDTLTTSDKSNQFNIPKYIKDGFDFIYPQMNESKSAEQF